MRMLGVSQGAGYPPSEQRLLVSLTQAGGMVGYPPTLLFSPHPFHCWAHLRTCRILTFSNFMTEGGDPGGHAPTLLPTVKRVIIPSRGGESGNVAGINVWEARKAFLLV